MRKVSQEEAIENKDLIFCSTMASGGQHKQVGLYNPDWGCKIEVDEGMVEILKLLWSNGYSTNLSCEDSRGDVWIDFPVIDFINLQNDLREQDYEGWEWLHDVVYDRFCNNPDAGSIFNFTMDEDYDGYDGRNIGFNVGLFFPIKHKKRFTELLRKLN